MRKRKILSGPGQKKAAVILLMLACGIAICHGQLSSGARGGSDYLALQPFDPAIAEYIEELMARAQGDDQKLLFEITRRVDFYFYAADGVEDLMGDFSDSLVPMIYQKDLFAGNPVKNTPAILRAPAVLSALNFSIRVLQPFYALAILATGVYLLFVAGSPSGRSKAKSTLIKLVAGLVLITMTVPIMEMLLELAHFLSSEVLSVLEVGGVDSPFSTDMFMEVKEFFMKYFLRMTFFDVLSGLVFLAAYAILPVGVLAVLAARYFMIILHTIFFPFTVLLYSFMSTKKMGRTLLNQIILWVFVPVIDAMVLVASYAAYKSVSQIDGVIPEAIENLRIFVAFAGFMLLAAAPLITFLALSKIRSSGMLLLLVRPAPAGRQYTGEKDESETDGNETDDHERIAEEVG